MTQVQQTAARNYKTATRNHLLAALPSDDFDLLDAHFERVPLNFRDMLIEAKEPLQHVYFPEQGIVRSSPM